MEGDSVRLKLDILSVNRIQAGLDTILYYMHSWDDTKSAFPSEWEFRPRLPSVVLKLY